MDISKIYQAYLQKITAPTTSKINSINNLTNTTDKSSSISGKATDQLTLGSNTPDLTGYLNYGAKGNYNSLTDLASLLNSDSTQNGDTSNLFGDSAASANDPSATPSLTDFLNDDTSTDSTDSDSLDSVFNSLAQSNDEYVNQLIQNALQKLNQSNSPNTAANATDKSPTSSTPKISLK